MLPCSVGGKISIDFTKPLAQSTGGVWDEKTAGDTWGGGIKSSADAVFSGAQGVMDAVNKVKTLVNIVKNPGSILGMAGGMLGGIAGNMLGGAVGSMLGGAAGNMLAGAAVNALHPADTAKESSEPGEADSNRADNPELEENIYKQTGEGGNWPEAWDKIKGWAFGLSPRDWDGFGDERPLEITTPASIDVMGRQGGK